MYYVACPSGWNLIGEDCYKVFNEHPYSNFQQSEITCQDNKANLPNLAKLDAAMEVNRQFQTISSPVYVDGTDGAWPDGTPVVGATNQPDTFRRYLMARFTTSGLIYTYSERDLPEMQRDLLCERSMLINTSNKLIKTIGFSCYLYYF